MSVKMTVTAVFTVLFVAVYKTPWHGALVFSQRFTRYYGCLSAHLDGDLYLITHTGIAELLSSHINTKMPINHFNVEVNWQSMPCKLFLSPSIRFIYVF